MTGAPRYSPTLTWTEFRIAASDETDLEQIVWESSTDVDDGRKRYDEADVAALREIDRLKVAGEYAVERARLAALLEPPSPSMQRIAQRIETGEIEPLRNFMDGLKSPDPVQRTRFERLYEKEGLAEKTPREFWHLLECLEPAKRKREGRPNIIPPWRGVASEMDAMRLLIARGASIPEAAREAARREGRQNVSPDNRSKYLENLYRQKMALRGKK